ncbi:MAG: type I 3-dehydroquinate dehydratase, partial [Chlamydiia bacterium]|nr:type I 3-dehydroquinate dehydratase [Chlamydiia bacterium]
MKLCVCIPGPSDVDVLAQCRSAMDAGADMLELRLDLWHEHALNVLQDLIAGRAVPMVLTFRTWREGGELRAERAAYQKLLLRLMALGADYVDVEAWVGPAFVLTLLDTKSDTQILISSHLSEPPADLEAEIAQLCKLPAAYHKLAYPMTSSCDALEALHYARRHERLILVGMGEAGQSTRILGGWAGVPWTYVCMEEDAPLASGQLSLSCLDAMYRARSISPSTRVYGLIGDPVVSSIGHYCHNAVMQRLGVDVVYIKWAVRSPELPRFLRLARLLGIRGLSVTMPHKEAVIACVEDVSPIALQMRAVNTLTLLGTGWKGDNTDGVGALRALRRVAKAQNRSLLLLGAGGAARAIGHQAKMEGWRVTV